MTRLKPIETDVLVIGAGMAGIRAAIEAHDHGTPVILTTKGVFGRDGASTWMASSGYSVALYPPDAVDTHIKDTVIAGKYLNNQDLVSALLRIAPQGSRELSKWGTRFVKVSKGKFKQVQLPGHTYPRSLITPISAAYPGPQYSRSLTSQVRRRKIKVVEDLFITDILTRDGRAVGAVGIDLVAGEFRVFKAKSIVLATGGASGCYKFTTNGTASSGDGYAIAYRAGAKLMDLEFQQFLPAAALWPPSVRGSATPYHMLVNVYGHFLNSQGERFMERYCPITKDWATRQETCRAIASEVKLGKASPHGGVYFAIKHQPRNLISRYLEATNTDSFFRKVRESGVDLHLDAIEVGPAAHYTPGGCWINERCETSLDGLYAAGEVASGADGADRLAGNALPFCMAMGIIAGREASLRASAIETPQIYEEQVEELRIEAFSPLHSQEGIKPLAIKNSLHDTMEAYASFNRSKEGLEAGLREINEVREKYLPRLYISAKNKRLNLEWMEAMETRNMVDVAEMTLRSALTRTESRGTHERVDYAQSDPKWLKNILIHKVKDRAGLSGEPVAFSHVKPQTGEPNA